MVSKLEIDDIIIWDGYHNPCLTIEEFLEEIDFEIALEIIEFNSTLNDSKKLSSKNLEGFYSSVNSFIDVLNLHNFVDLLIENEYLHVDDVETYAEDDKFYDFGGDDIHIMELIINVLFPTEFIYIQHLEHLHLEEDIQIINLTELI